MARGNERTIEEVIGLVQSLVPYLQKGSSLKMACRTCKIPYTSMLEYIEKYEDVRTLIEASENFLDSIAESVVAEKIVEERDIKTAKWWLERVQRERYSLNSKVIELLSEKQVQETKSYIVVTHDTWSNLTKDEEKMAKLSDEERRTLVGYLDKMEIKLVE
jgi:hypothetical protein